MGSKANAFLSHNRDGIRQKVILVDLTGFVFSLLGIHKLLLFGAN